MNVDWHGAKEAGSRKVVLLFYSCNEFESTLGVSWNGVGAAGLPYTDPVS